MHLRIMQWIALDEAECNLLHYKPSAALQVPLVPNTTATHASTKELHTLWSRDGELRSLL